MKFQPKKKADQPKPEKVYPVSLECERAVLAALLSNEKAIIDTLSAVTPEDFVDEDHKVVLRIVAELFQKQKPIDLVTVSVEFKKHNDRKSNFVVADLFKQEFTADYPVHVRTLKDLARRRRVQAILDTAQEKIGGKEETDKIVAEAISGLYQSSEGQVNRPIPLDRGITMSLKRLEAAMEKGSSVTGIPTGFAKFDSDIGGVQPGEVMIIAARPSMGKSSWLGCAALGSARLGHPTLIVNAEMELVELTTRFLAKESRVANIDLRRGALDDSEIADVMTAAGKLSPLPVSIYDENRWEIIKTQIRSHKIVVPNLGLVLIDYVQRLRLELQDGENRYQALGRVVKDSKDLAKELKIGIVLAAQINRAVEKEKREPQLSDLRESGDLEQDSDIVGFLHGYKPKDEPWDRWLIIRKNRNGTTGSIHLRFVGAEVAYYDWVD